MNEPVEQGDGATLTRSERWATYVVAHAANAVWPIVFLCVALVLFLVVGDMLAGVLFVFLAAVYWERLGFKRLLARRDAEIRRLRSGGGSA